jgi:DNA-binding GntR family transcriptional regulator
MLTLPTVLLLRNQAATAVAQSLDELDRLLEAIKREDPQKAAMSIRGLGA